MKKDKKQELFIQDYKILLRKYYNDINVNKRNKGKLKGALVANLIKKYIEQIIMDYKLPYKVSGNNVYIYGYAVECDLLILKQDSKNTGYEKALPIIDEWLENDNPNTRRAVTEGLRIWTSRPYFKDNPNEAIRRIVALKEDPSEYVRKSVGNALRDISKKFPELIKDELNNWKLESKEINQVYKLASKLIN